MTELLRNAWSGWQNYTDNGKLCALLLASLVFLWVYYKRTEQRTLLIYAALMTVSCILPVTAALLMIYQTRFYDYRWIWSLVPGTLITALAAVLLMTRCWPDFSRAGWKKGLPVALMLTGLLLLSGGLGQNPLDSEREKEARILAEGVLSRVQERSEGREICLWAPEEIMEYAREIDSGIRLIYGRNMWDPALNAYSYDACTSEEESLSRWMYSAQSTGAAEGADDCARAAADAGVNCILLPENLETEIVACFEEILGIRAEKIPGYYLLMV